MTSIGAPPILMTIIRILVLVILVFGLRYAILSSREAMAKVPFQVGRVDYKGVVTWKDEPVSDS